MIDSDDKAFSTAIELLYKFLNINKDVGLVHGRNLIIDEQSRVCYWRESNNLFKSFYIDKNMIYYQPYKDKINVCSKKKAKYFSYTDYLEKTHGIKINSKEYGTYSTLLDKSFYLSNGFLIRRNILMQLPCCTNINISEDFF